MIGRNNDDEIIRTIAQKLIEQAKNKGKTLSKEDAISLASGHVELIYGITSRTNHQPYGVSDFAIRLSNLIKSEPTLKIEFIKSYIEESEINGEVNMNEIISMLLYILLTRFPELFLYYTSKFNYSGAYEIYLEYNSTY